METVGIYYFSNIAYSFLTQRPQQLFKAWRQPPGGGDLRFFYVEPPCPSLKVHGHGSGYFVILPWEHPQAKQAIKALVEACCRREPRFKIAISPAVWEPFLAKEQFKLICYDYYDRITPAEDGGDATIAGKHQRMLLRSDLVFVTNEQLRLEAVGATGEGKVLTVSNGVDTAFFQANRSAWQPSDYGKRGPVVGFVGAILDWVDLDLVFQAAVMMPGVDFIMIGPVSEGNGQYTRANPANVVFLGAKPYGQIPSYIDLLDVAVLPFRQGNTAYYADPIVTYEYFALGKPVVATPIEQIKRYADGRLARIAGTAEEFAEAIGFFLSHGESDWARERRRVAAENSWLNKAELILSALAPLVQQAEA